MEVKSCQLSEAVERRVWNIWILNTILQQESQAQHSSPAVLKEFSLMVQTSVKYVSAATYQRNLGNVSRVFHCVSLTVCGHFYMVKSKVWAELSSTIY